MQITHGSPSKNILEEPPEIIVIVLVTPKAVSTKLVVVVMGRLKLGAWKRV